MEILVYSKPGYIDFMPGWPSEYPDGYVEGVLVRGGHKIDITWANGKLISAVLHAGADSPCTLRYGDLTNDLKLKAGQAYQIDSSLGVIESVEKGIFN